MTENQLIEECMGGNFTNFGMLVRITAPIAYSVAFRILGDEEQAKDIVQETMVVIWQKIKKMKASEAYRKWMYRIVVNKCYDHIRKRRKNPEFSAGELLWNRLSEIVSGGYSTPLENEESAMIITLLTNRLSAKQKIVFILSETEGMTHDEISEITGMSKTAIKANLWYARRNISEMVDKYL